MLTQDLRYAWRMWRAHPLSTAAAIVSLAVGMGANTAVFSVLDAVLFKSAPVGDPATLALVYSTKPATGGLHGNSFQNFEDLRRTLPFDLAAAAPLTIGFTADGGLPNEVPAEIVSDNYFSLLRVRAAQGRVFAPGEEAAAGASAVVVLSESFWQRRFGARADVVGTTVSINSRPFVVVGVAAAGFAGLDVMRPADVWIPLWKNADALTGVQRFYFRQRSSEMFGLVARLASQKDAEVRSLLASRAADLERAFPSDNRGLALTSRPLSEAGLDPARRDVWVRAGGLLTAVVALVLMLACANVANLLLARSAARRREISLRLAIGASRRRLARQFVTESALLSVSGGLGGLLVAAAGLRLLVALRPPFIPPTFAPSLDLTTLAFTGLLAIGTAIVFGLVPILYVSRDDVVGGLKGAPIRRAGATRIDPSRALLMLQSMLAMVTLVLAGLFLRDLQRARTIDPGFQTARLAVLSFDLGVVQYDNVRGPEFVRQANEAVRAIPGVTTSAVSSHVVLEGTGLEAKVRLVGQADAEALGVHAQAVGLDYFATLGIRLVEGRTFRPTDTGVSAFGWAVVNRTLARQLWPGRSALGERFQLLGIPEPYVVVGIVEDAQYELLGEAARPFFYIYYDQAPGIKKLSLFVRTDRDPESLLPAIERAVQAIDPRLPISNARTMTGVLRQAMWAPRIGSALLTVFGAIALVLAVVGMYGVTAFLVRRRQRDIGIRIAIGATPLRILGGVVSWTLMPALAGIVLGLGLARICARLSDGLLIGGAVSDVRSFAGAAAVLVVSAAIASVLPALAALRLDPTLALRRE